MTIFPAFNLFFTAVVIVTLFGCTPKQTIPPAAPPPFLPPKELVSPPKNIILMIGDGMGLSQITAGMYANNNYLNLERMSHTGLQKTHASDDLVTDSAAGATAFACGVKTYNGAIGVNPDTIPVVTILEQAEERNMATGLIATSEITHATPASFIAHVSSRRKYEEIASYFLKTEVDLFIGGGRKYFERRKDEMNISDSLRSRGYDIRDYFNEELTEIQPDPKLNFGFFTADQQPLTVEQGRDYLLEATEKGMRFLKKRSGENGFFLMIEGSQIDWGGHANKGDYIVNEMIDFDKAIGAAMDFIEKDGETLLIITADHETGGFSINQGSKMDSLVTAFTTDLHTASLIPVFAHGPGAELFSGMYDNTEIYHKMRLALGL